MMMRTKRIKMGVTTAIFAMSLLFTGLFACKMPRAAVSAAFDQQDFFTIDGGSITAMPNTTVDDNTGMKLHITPAADYVNVAYRNEIDAAQLSEFLRMQIIPSSTTGPDFNNMSVILEDSANAEQQVAISVTTSETGFTDHTSVLVSLTDDIKIDMYGYAKIGETDQSAVGWCPFEPNYSATGAIFLEYNGMRMWDAPVGKNGVFSYFGNKNTMPLSFSLADNRAKVANILAADLADESFYTASTTVPHSYADRYTADYVKGLFSSGKVKMTIRFGGFVKDSEVYRNVTVNMLSIAGQDLALGSKVTAKGAVVNVKSETEGDVTTNIFTLHKVDPFNKADRVELSFDTLMNKADLNDFLQMKLIPSAKGVFDCRELTVLLEDSVDVTQQLAIAVSQNASWYDSQTTTARVALTSDIAREAQHTKIAGTKQDAIGWDAMATESYHYLGRMVGEWNSAYGIFGYDDATPIKAMKFSFAENKVNINGDLAADIADEAFHAASKVEPHPYTDRYTADYVDGLFSSGKIKLSMRFEGLTAAEGDAMNPISFELIKMAGFTEGRTYGLTDTTAPVVTAKAENQKVTVKTKVDLMNYINISDSDTELTATVSVNGVPLKNTTEYVPTMLNDLAVIYTVADSAGNFTTFHLTLGVQKQLITADLIEAIANCIYTGSAIEPPVAVTGLNLGTDYEVSYSQNINAGTATVMITGKGNYSGTLSKDFTIVPKTLTKDLIEAIENQTYTGSAVEPAVTVAGLVLGTDYTVSYADNTNAGTATVTVTGKGNYAGTLNITFEIEGNKKSGGCGAATFSNSGTATAVLAVFALCVLFTAFMLKKNCTEKR